MASPEASPKFDLHSEEIIVEFDRARHDNQFVDLEASVSQVPGEIRPRLLAELACIDLEHLFERGQMVTTSPFLMLYPDIFKQHAMREIVAKEHYRLCCISGANVSPAEIAQRYCVEGGAWTALPRGEPCPTSKIDIPDIAFPEVGSTFCDYLLIAELGRGALARVYIAKQPDLAERWVVLKVTQRHTAEADQLAQLQHSGIIPVYSIHREQDLHCICMPYLGAVTLRDLLSDGRLFSHSPSSCHALASTIVSERLSTIVASTHTPKGSAAFLRQNTSAEPLQLPTIAEAIDEDRFRDLLGLAELADSLQRQFLNRDSLTSKVDLMVQLTAAVGYAHSRGVVHRDLKPENILIANDGRPIVLDFNLAVSTSINDWLYVGGTLPYMSPQQLRSIDSVAKASAQDDVFAIGVLCYQLLIGKFPFDDSHLNPNDWELLAENHTIKLPSAHSLGSKFPASLNSIVMKCLAPCEASRYANANEVHEDLQRFTQHQVLRHAADTSPVERVRKWIRRHPVLSSTSSLVLVSLLVVSSVVGALIAVHARGLRMEASNLAGILHAELPETLAMLRSPGGEPDLLHDGLASASQIVDRWQIEDFGFASRSAWMQLSEVEQGQVSQHLGNLLFAMAGAEAQLAVVEEENREKGLAAAGKLNKLAAVVHPDLSAAVELRTHTRNAMASFERAMSSGESKARMLGDVENTFAQMLIARDAGQTEEWLKLADQLVSDHPVDPTYWFTLASAKYAKGDFAGACDAFDVSSKLQRQSAMSTFWRGVSRLNLGQSTLASEDFSTCIALRPDWISPRYNRALAYRADQKIHSAIDDLNWIANSGQAGPRVYSLRSQLYAAAGDQERATEDFRLTLSATPRDADDWVSRGVLKISRQPSEALSDFARALEIAPKHVAAHLNIAHVQAEVCSDNAAAIETLSKLINSGLGGTSPIASRGILEARSGRIEQALADAQSASSSKPTALEMLQVAGIYAIISKQTGVAAAQQDAIRDLGLVWLARSLAADPGLRDLAASDPDLVNLGGLPTFKALVGVRSH